MAEEGVQLNTETNTVGISLILQHTRHKDRTKVNASFFFKFPRICLDPPLLPSPPALTRPAPPGPLPTPLPLCLLVL